MEWTVVYRGRPIELAPGSGGPWGPDRHGSRPFARRDFPRSGEHFQGSRGGGLSDAFSGSGARLGAVGAQPPRAARGPRLARRPGDRRSGGGLAWTATGCTPSCAPALLDTARSSTFTCCRCSPTPRSFRVVGPRDFRRAPVRTAPVRTRWLVGLPMLYGGATIFTLMLIDHAAERLHYTHSSLFMFVRWFPWELDLFSDRVSGVGAGAQVGPSFAARAASSRLAMVVVGLPSALLAVLFIRLLLNIRWYENQMLWIYCPLIVCAYLFAVVGVALDRRGDRFDWATPGRWLVRALPALPARGWEFGSPAAAQRWLEVRRCAWMLPMVMVLFFVVLLWSALLPFNEADVARSLVAFMWVPAVAGFFIGFSTGKSSFWAADLRLSSGVTAAAAHRSCVAAAAHAQNPCRRGQRPVDLGGRPDSRAGVGAALGSRLGRPRPPRRVVSRPPRVGTRLARSGGARRTCGITWFQIVAGMCLRPRRAGLAVVNGVVLLYGVLGATSRRRSGHLGRGSIPIPSARCSVILWCLAGRSDWPVEVGCIDSGPEAASVPDLDRTMPQLALVWLVVAGCLVVAIELDCPPSPFRQLSLLCVPWFRSSLARLITVPLSPWRGIGTSAEADAPDSIPGKNPF